jgi:hypothetical protein
MFKQGSIPPSNARSYRWGNGEFNLLNVKDKKNGKSEFLFLFLHNKISVSKICIRCDRKVFKVSDIQQFALKVAQHVFFQKVIFTKSQKVVFKGYYKCICHLK